MLHPERSAARLDGLNAQVLDGPDLGPGTAAQTTMTAVAGSAATLASVPALDVSDLSVVYAGKPALIGVSVSIAAGRMTAIVGPNGAGKSTLLKSILDLVPIATGRVRVFGAAARDMHSRIAYVPQRVSVDWEFPTRVRDVVAMGLYRELGLLGRLTPTHRARIADCLARVGMAEFADRQIGQLSGGQQQRVFLARALAQGADLFLLDEPFAGVDAATEASILDVLRGLQRDGRTVVCVHHDLGTVATYFDDAVLLNRTIVASGPVRDVMTREHLQAAYRGLLVETHSHDIMRTGAGGALVLAPSPARQSTCAC